MQSATPERKPKKEAEKPLPSLTRGEKPRLKVPGVEEKPFNKFNNDRRYNDNDRD